MNEEKRQGTLFLIPTPISEETSLTEIPPYILNTVQNIQYFICERIRTTRRYFRKLDKSFDIDSRHFYELEKSGKNAPLINDVLQWLKAGRDVAILSESGCPCVADPGFEIASKAHENGYKVAPLVGPSSIMMALMASGLNGQLFSFHGYLPVKDGELMITLKNIEKEVLQHKSSHIFIETPYRNQKIINALVQNLSGNIKICLAKDITGSEEKIITKTVAQWKMQIPELDKTPCIFIVGI